MSRWLAPVALIVLSCSACASRMQPLPQYSPAEIDRFADHLIIGHEVLVNLPVAGIMGEYRPSEETRDALQRWSETAQLLANQFAVANDMTNHGTWSRVMNKATSILEAGATAYGIFDVARQIEDAGVDLGRAKLAAGSALLARGINTLHLEGAVAEARFIVEAGKRLEYLQPRAVEYADSARAISERESWPSLESYKNALRQTDVLALDIARSQREIMSLVPDSYVDSKQALKSLDELIARMERRILAGSGS